MEDWAKKMFVDRADLFLKIMNPRWARTELLVDGMVKILKDYGIEKGRILDLFCGNGRVSVTFARKGFSAVGVDVSPIFIDDAISRAKALGVSESVKFVQGDARKLLELLPEAGYFDAVVNAWTSIGFFGRNDDLSIFRQARRLTREGGLLFIAEASHRDYANLRFGPSLFTQYEDTVVLENPVWNTLTSRLKNVWSFYAKEGDDLKFIDRIGFDIYIYSASELASLLQEAGWETLAAYGSLATQQPFTPLTAMNLVARAIEEQ